MDLEASRREFLKSLALVGGGMCIPAFLLSCAKDEDKKEILDATKIPENRFDMWRELLKALKASPDHYLARREALVAAKDPKAMTEFVRDHIQLLPFQKTFLYNLGTAGIYGAKSALRCGMGSAFEKAQILKEMLEDAGFSAAIIHETVELSEEELKSIVFRNYRPEFAPAIDENTVKKMRKKMKGAEEKGEVASMDSLSDRANKLGENLFDFLKDERFNNNIGNSFNINSRQIPTVVYKNEEDEDQFAHVFDPSVPFGELHPTNERKVQRTITRENKAGSEEVTIELFYRTVKESKKEQLLLEGKWTLEDLSGSMIFLKFMNNMSLKMQVTKTINDINTFTPCFIYQKIGEDKEFMTEQSVVGDPINFNGEKLRIPEEEEVENGKSNSDTDNVKADPSDVEELNIEVLPKAFPEVRVEVYTRDAKGNPVENLKAPNFKLIDNDTTVSGFMHSDGIAPKILLLSDISGSMPAEYRGKGMEQFAENLEEMILELYPLAEIEYAPTHESNIYTLLLKAKQRDFDFIIYTTDGDNTDKFDEKHRDIYLSGHPTLFLEARPGNPMYDELQENIQNMISISAEDQELTYEKIKELMEEMEFPTYVFTYPSFDEDKEHLLRVELRDTEHADEKSFTFSDIGEMELEERMIGLYLKIKQGRNAVTRTLAGWDPELVSRFELKDEYLEEVHEMLLGGATLSFEREAPPLSIRLSEYIETLLSNEKWITELEEGDTEQALEYLEEGVLEYPPLFLSMMQPMEGFITTESITYPKGYRACILKTKPGLYENSVSVESFDYLPTADYVTVSKDGSKVYNFKETLKKTAQFGLLEAAVYETSTYDLLQDVDIGLKSKDYVQRDAKDKNPELANRLWREGSHVLFDKNYQSPAYYKIDRNNGNLYANLLDATGGGKLTTEQRLQRLDEVVKGYERWASAMSAGMTLSGVGGFALGVVANYGVTLVKLYALATETLILMDNRNLEEGVKEALLSFACEVAKDIVYLATGPVGTGASFVEDIIGVLGGESKAISC